MNRPIFTVILLTYNSSKTIKKCLLSLENQTNKKFEVLIVDDDSKDDTLSIIRSLEKNLSFKIRYLRNGAHSISIGRNIGIKATKTKYYTFLDSDAYADKNWISEFIKEFEKNPNLVVVGGDTLPVYTNHFSYANGLVYETIRNLTRKGVWKLEGGNAAYDNKKLRGLYFNEKFKHCEDIEFFTRINDKFDKQYSKKIKVDHESRDTLKRFFKQQYEYGKWEILFSLVKGKKIRILSLVPSILILASIFLVFVNALSLFILPIISLLESILVIIYKRVKISLWIYIYLSWLIKNTGWGIGVVSGLLVFLIKKEFIKNISR